jgi:hypothetical protein
MFAFVLPEFYNAAAIYNPHGARCYHRTVLCSEGFEPAIMAGGPAEAPLSKTSSQMVRSLRS